ncbi:MAG: LCP family protein [Bacillota bacterium]
MFEERRNWLSWLLAGLIGVALIGGLAFYRPFQAPVQAVAPALEPPPPPPQLDSLGEERKTFLVMGVDTTEQEFGRADSMVVVSYDARGQRIAMLSIPRDTWTLIPGHGYDKINHAYAYGGHPLAVDTVERLLGIEIDHWVILSFEGFTNVVNAVGGVEIDVEKRIYYEDPYDERMGEGGLVIDIQPGLQTMDGLTALKYARFRADEEGDLGRMRRQQQVIKALIQKAATPAILAKLPQLIPAMASAVGTDLSVAEMLRLAATGREALGNPLVTGSLGGNAALLDGIFYLATDIVASRTTAYEVLVGRPPDEAFLERAREEQKVYSAALQEAIARSEENMVAAAGVEPRVGTDAGAAPGNADPPGDQSQAGPKPGGADPSGSATRPAGPKAELITVALVDSTGQGLAKEYLHRLRAAGFRVVRVTRLARPIKTTVVIDHANQPQVEERLRAIFPDLLYAAAPDPKAEQSMEIILGTDLLERKP